ncbi:MAG: Transposase, Mutator family [Methanocella sp. PtaU1.Bin125]|nr:MAG: Transposase, Mutator family [Methanocella sp. PtaU1.Bin125]
MNTELVDVLLLFLKYLRQDDDGMKNILTWLYNAIMQVEAELQAGCSSYERNNDRRLHRNGYKKRTLKTVHGDLVLDKPQFREEGFTTVIFEAYGRVEKAVISLVGESYLLGISTRKIEEMLSKLGIDGFSAASVSKINKELDEQVHAFLERPLGRVVYMYVDATYFRVREGARYVTKALLIVVGVDQDGYRQVLGARICESESEEWWTSMFEDLQRRGLYGVLMVISDGHRGIKAAVQKCFLGASWQYCQVHFVRNVMKKVPQKRRREIAGLIRACREDPRAMANLSDALNEQGLEAASRMIDSCMADLFNYMAFPKMFWKKIRTTNLLENTNRKLKQRSKVVGAFPGDASLLRLAVTILMDTEEEWKYGHRLIDLEDNPINETGPIIQITENF